VFDGALLVKPERRRRTTEPPDVLCILTAEEAGVRKTKAEDWDRANKAAAKDLDDLLDKYAMSILATVCKLRGTPLEMQRLNVYGHPNGWREWPTARFLRQLRRRGLTDDDFRDALGESGLTGGDVHEAVKRLGNQRLRVRGSSHGA